MKYSKELIKNFASRSQMTRLHVQAMFAVVRLQIAKKQPRTKNVAEKLWEQIHPHTKNDLIKVGWTRANFIDLYMYY